MFKLLRVAPDHPGDAELATKCTDRTLRQIDIALALLILGLVGLPYLVARAIGRVDTALASGTFGRPIVLRRLELPRNLGGRFLRALGARLGPLAMTVLRGDLAWVGPPAGSAEDASHRIGPSCRPGVITLWDVRRRFAVAYGTEADVTREYLTRRGVRHDLGLMLRGALAHAFTAERPPTQGRVRIVDVEFDNIDMDEALERIEAMLDRDKARQVSFVNPACVNIAAGHRGYRRALGRASLVLPDGIGIKVAADILGTPLRQNLNGTDLFPRLCERLARRRARVYLLGGRPGVPERVANVIAQRWPGVTIVGIRNGYFQRIDEAAVVADIRAARADVVVVARGVPVQEEFIDRYLPQFGARAVLGVGGLFDFMSGRIPRAPQWMRDVGLEWIWRLMQEPRRMSKRYIVGNFTFLGRVLAQRLRLPLLARHQPADADQASPQTRDADEAVMGIVIADTVAHESMPVAGGYPSALLPFGSVSLIEQTVMQMVDAGVRELHLVAAVRPDLLRAAVGDGQRWGARIIWHVPKDRASVADTIRLIARRPAPRTLLAMADRWISPLSVRRLSAEPMRADAIDGADVTRWAGWATLPTRALQHVATGYAKSQLDSVLDRLLSTRLFLGQGEWGGVGTARDLLTLQRWTHGKDVLRTQTNAWVAHSWGYASPSAVISPRAHVKGPAWIGAGCVVEEGAMIGADVVLGHDVIVDRDAIVEHSVVFPSTYVGRCLSVREALLNGDRLLDVRLGAGISLSDDPHVLGRVAPTRASDRRQVERFAAVAAALMLAPLAAAAAAVHVTKRLPARCLRRTFSAPGSSLSQVVLRLPPSSYDPSVWSCRVLETYGRVLDVAQGQRAWLGVRPRRAAEWYALHPEWRSMMENAPIGAFVMPAWADAGHTSVEAEAAADLLLVSQPSWWARLRQLARAAVRSRWGGNRPPILRVA